MAKMILHQGTILDPLCKEPIIGDLVIEGQIISQIGSEAPVTPGDIVINAKGKYITPGFIDLQVNPGAGMAQAAKFLALTGVTTPLFHASNSYDGIPLIDKYGGISKMIEACSGLTVNSALCVPIEPPDATGHETYESLRCELSEVGNRVEYFKSLGLTAIGEVVLPLEGIAHVESNLSAETLDSLLDATERLDMPILVHTGLGLRGILAAIKIAGNRKMHLCHVGSTCAQDSINAALHALGNSPNISSDTHLSEFAGTSSKQSHLMLNALRQGKVYKIDRETLLSHPITSLENEVPPFYYFKPNLFENNIVCALSDTITAIESDDMGDGIRSSLMLKNVFRLSTLAGISSIRDELLLKLIRKMTLSPALILGINKGTLALGSDADIAIIDANTGKIEWTIVLGTVVVANGKLTGENPGRFVIRDR